MAVALIGGAGALAKIVDPRPAIEHTSAVLGDRWLAAGLVILAVATEAALAAVAVLHLADRIIVLFAGASFLALMAMWLAYGTFVAGVSGPCGCMPGFRQVDAVQGLVLNLLVAAELLVAGLSERGLRDTSDPLPGGLSA
ncbi:MAG TPA: hypothetical protein VFS92_11575 [Planctomycetota bacterium]|nr:hypothetical protein [Planctomycetota bacterium]